MCFVPKQFASASEALAYYTECQLATVADLRTRKSFPKGELKRHENLATGMVQACKMHCKNIRDNGWGQTSVEGQSCSRLYNLIRESQ